MISLTLICCWWLILPIQNDAKKLKMTETLARGYSSESTQWEHFNENQHDSAVYMVIKNSSHHCALDESSIGIDRVNTWLDMFVD